VKGIVKIGSKAQKNGLSSHLSLNSGYAISIANWDQKVNPALEEEYGPKCHQFLG
jgi:hypothetical protein